MADVLGKKISELAETTDFAGLYTIGSDRNNQSKKVPLQFIKEAADYANAQGDYAKGVGDTVQGNTGVDEYPVFSALTQYAAGSVVRYNDRLYRFTALHPAGAWVGTDAIETSIKAETDVKLTELESAINGVTLTYNALDYLKVPTIAAGEKARITVISSDLNVSILLYAKTSVSDSSYQSLGGCRVGETIEILADREINYIKVYNVEGAIPVVLSIVPQDAIKPKLSVMDKMIPRYCTYSGVVKLYDDRIELTDNGALVGGNARHDLKSILTIPKSLDANYFTHFVIINMETLSPRLIRSENVIDISEKECILCLVRWGSGFIWCNCPNIEYSGVRVSPISIPNLELKMADIVGVDILYTGTGYEKIKTIEKGQSFRITLKNKSSDHNVLIYARTELDDSYYQTVGEIVKNGDSIEAVANIDINYIRVYDDTYSVYPLTINLSMADSLSARVKALESQSSYTPCMFNPPINFEKADLKIFDIGNSYTQDAQAYLPNIINAARLENNFSLYRAFRPSGSFKSWVDCWNNKDSQPYNVVKCAGNDIEGIAGSGNIDDGSVFRNSLTSVKWDVILIHQVSGYANNFAEWSGNGNGGYLKELIQILRKTNPQATIGFLLVHSYRSNYGSNTEGSSLKRWENIAQATKDLKNAYGIDFIIPYGTAVQNLRASSLSDEYEFSEDGTHLADGLGDYVASCCYFQSLFAPRFGVSILGNTFSYSTLDESVGGRKAITPENALVAQKAAMLATYNMWDVLNPDEYEL